MDGVFRFSYNWPLPGVYFFSVTVHTTQIGNGIIIAFNYAMCTIFSPLYYYTIIQFHFKASMRFNFTFVLVLQLYFSRITAAAYTIVLYIRNCFRFVIILFVMISTLNSFSQISFHRGAGWGDTGRRKGSYDKWEIFNRTAFNGKRRLIIRVNRVGMNLSKEETVGLIIRLGAALHGKHIIIFYHAFWWVPISFHILINDVRYRKS